MQGALAGLPRPRNDMVTYSVPHGGLSRTGQLPPLLQAAGWERASPAGSVQISCPFIGGKGQAWQDTNE